MGEAKRKREAFKQQLINEIERWNFPTSEAERQAVEEIKLLPVVTVRRLSSEHLSYMRMKPNQCHTNARFMETADPERQHKQVAGYWFQLGNYVFHSVVQNGDDYFCVTPLLANGPDVFDFIPDPDIEWREENDYRVAYRKGVPVEPGFRSDPDEVKRVSEIVLARMEAGMDPIKAGEPPF